MNKARRGWRWRVLDIYDARCESCAPSPGWVVWTRINCGNRRIGYGITAPMAWRNAWQRIEAEAIARAVYNARIEAERGGK
jgi:hypothetical protein